MKEFDNCLSNNLSIKQEGKSKKHKLPFKLLVKNYSPKVMISRENTTYKKTKEFLETPRLLLLEESLDEVQAKEEKINCDVERLCCDENCTNLKKKGEQSVCLNSNFNEAKESFKVCKTLLKTGKSLKELNELEEKNGFDCSLERSVIFEVGNQKKPIFVDLTTDEKNTRKQTILKRVCDIKMNMANEKESSNVILESRIIIADSTSKLSCNGNGSFATALRDRGPCLIPTQPNRSLPIRPVPSVPTRSFRKDCLPLLILPKSTALNVVETKSVKSGDTLLSEELCKHIDINSGKKMDLKKPVSSMDYIVPKISGVGSLNVTKRKNGDDMKDEKDNVKENKKRKKLREADSSQSREEHIESSIKEFLTNFCGSNATGGIQNLCTDKCSKIDSTTNEKSNKLVPPLRLKKVVCAAEIEGYDNSQIITGSEHESNYRIITGTTSQPPPSPINWNDELCEKDINHVSLSSDVHKRKYRRNRLKQKLRELRSKALILAKQMANDSNSQQSTRLRQVMNCYEKQIENLSKLHRKLSAGISVSNEAINVNDKSESPPNNEYPFINLNEIDKGSSVTDSSPISSPEPPKLSPRLPLSYDSILPQEIRNSPPILPKVCVAIPSCQDSMEEELHISERKMWPIKEDSTKSTFSADSDQLNCANKTVSNFETHTQTVPLDHQNISVNIENVDLADNKRSLSHFKKITKNSEDNCVIREKKNENNKLVEGFTQSHLMIQEPNIIKCLEFFDPEPIANSMTSNIEVPTAAQEKEIFKSTPGKQFPSKQSKQGDISFAKVNKSSGNVQKIASNSGQSTELQALESILSQEHLTLQQNCKGEERLTDSVKKNDGNHSITEQFPTLGNWLARMSKKQTSKVKSKLQSTGDISFASPENTTRVRQIPGLEIPKMVGTTITNDIINSAAQCSTEKWQYHHQQQRQQLLQVAASVTPTQPITTVPSLRPGICPPMPISPFYPNSYTVDHYNGATLSYHPAICPYGTYPYHSRLHSNAVPGYHFPMQESLRPMQHVDKRFPPLQDSMMRYSSPSTNTLQHQSNLEFDRLRGNYTNTNIGNASCLPPLFLSPQSLSSSHQALPRPPLVSYPTNSHVSRNRIIPDVVAAAAAAAVVAAASFDTQRDALAYNRTDAHTLSTTGITNIIGREPSHVSSSSKSIINRDATDQTQNNNFSNENHENTKFQQTQNILFDRLALVKAADNFTQTNSVISNDSHATMASIVATPYRMSLIPSHPQLSKNVPGNESRNCETPHLGKMNRSPHSLHNFTCSNCGIMGPKFKCLGCEIAFYCDERCQEKHWYVHVQRCPKKMPKLKKVT